MNSLNLSGFKVVIVHENTISGMQAVGVLEWLAQQLGTKLGTHINAWQLQTRAWKFEWLWDPKWWEDAVAMSVAADVIIIAGGALRELPANVRSWIESVLPRKRHGPAALVALLEGQGEAGNNMLSPGRYLRDLARQYGVDFFCNLDDRPQQAESCIEPILSSLEAVSQ